MAAAIEEFLELEKSAASSRSDRDLEAWNVWTQNGKTQVDTEYLLKRTEGIIRKSANRFAAQQDVPKSAVLANFQTEALKAFDKFDPNRGVKLSTFLTGQLRRGDRFIHNYQNVGRIPETRIFKITQFKNERMLLSDKLGRVPSSLELSDHLKWPTTQVIAMESELRLETPASHFQGEAMTFMPSKDKELLRLLPYELAADEKAVFEYSMGVNGKVQLSPGAIAKILNMHPSKVSRLRTSIAKKAEQYR